MASRPTAAGYLREISPSPIRRRRGSPSSWLVDDLPPQELVSVRTFDASRFGENTARRRFGERPGTCLEPFCAHAACSIGFPAQSVDADIVVTPSAGVRLLIVTPLGG